MTVKLERHSAQLATLGQPLRLAIWRYVLQRGPYGTSLTDLQTHLQFQVNPKALDLHLQRLVEAGLLVQRVDGTFVFYAAVFEELRSLTDYLWEGAGKFGSDPFSPPSSRGPRRKKS